MQDDLYLAPQKQSDNRCLILSYFWVILVGDAEWDSKRTMRALRCQQTNGEVRSQRTGNHNQKPIILIIIIGMKFNLINGCLNL